MLTRIDLTPMILLILAYALLVPTGQTAGMLGISPASSNYEFHQLDTRSGQSRLIAKFEFDSPFWYPASLTFAADGSRIYALSKTRHSPLLGGLFYGSSLHEFAPNNGELVAKHRLDRDLVGEVEALHALSSGRLVGIAERYALVEVDPSNGALTVLNKVPFDSGSWSADTFTVDPTETRAFAIMRGNRVILVGKIPYGNTLYAFDLADGEIVSTKLLGYPKDRAIEALHALSPDRLVGITDKHELIEILPSTGEVRVISKVNFDSGYWHPGSFTVSPDGRRAYAMSKTHYAPDLGKTLFGNTLHEFDLSDGSLLSTHRVKKIGVGGFEAMARVPLAWEKRHTDRTNLEMD